MRIAVLATKINRSVKEIQDYLVSSNNVDYQNQNTKLTSEHVEDVLNHFKIDKDEFYSESSETNYSTPENDAGKNLPDIDSEHEPEQITNMATDSNSDLPEKVNSEFDDHTESPEQVENIEENRELPNEPLQQNREDELDASEKNEVIRAPKIKLDGPKIVGKIELPEIPRKNIEPEKAEEENIDKTQAEEKDKPSKRPKRIKKGRQKNYSKGKKPLSYSEKLEKEKREAERIRKKELKEAKKRKRQHYEQMIQGKNPQLKTTKKKKKRPAQTRPVEKKVKKEYSNPITRFWAWLNDEL